MSVAWAVTPEKISEAIQTIVQTAQPQRVILFGSAARGKTNRDSDADFLVVTKRDVSSPCRESVRIRRALRGLSMPMDIVVVSARRLREFADRPGMIYREALQHGQVVYDATA